MKTEAAGERKVARFLAGSTVFFLPLNFLVTKITSLFKIGKFEKSTELLLKKVPPGNLERGRREINC